MKKGQSLSYNIGFLLEQYKKELDIENSKDILIQDIDLIMFYQNVIIELAFALQISK